MFTNTNRYAREFAQLDGIGNHKLTRSHRTRTIPNGCYDTGEGFYNPTTKCLYDPKDVNRILRIPTSVEEKWIMKYCRKAWRETIGPNFDMTVELSCDKLDKVGSISAGSQTQIQ